jgi:poly-gamma-glutamate capsule biosynthesis protein CapA/YwtB (metallophosphatase superfamily)
LPTTCASCHVAVALASLLVDAGADCVHSAGRSVSQGRESVVAPEAEMARQAPGGEGEGAAIQ